jgi:hypothetical protein
MEAKTGRVVVGAVGFCDLGVRRHFSRGRVCLERERFSIPG